MATTYNPLVYQARENIPLTPLSALTPGSNFVTEQNCVSFNLSYTLTGGSFSISLLQGSVYPLPNEDAIISLPFGRVGVVKQVGGGWNRGGLVGVISGPILPLLALQQTFYAILSGTRQSLINVATAIASASASGSAVIGGSSPGYALVWLATLNPIIGSFSYRGPTLQGIQQVANIMLADVVVRKDGVYVVNPGAMVPSGGTTGFGGYPTGSLQYTPFTVPKTDLVTANQIIDYSLDVASMLNPALGVVVNTGLPGQYVYDNEHAVKQPKFTVQCGQQDANSFINIPDGWLVDGTYEEWQPANQQDNSNPDSTVPNGRYWKVFPSPTNQGFLRGITDFKRLIKELHIPGNVSNFIGSPITATTQTGSVYELVFDVEDFNGGISGFDSTGPITVQDAISDQYLTFNNAIVLTPRSGDAGIPAYNFYSITMEIWTFPLVNPITFQAGPSTNPFHIPNGVVVVSPNQSVINGYPAYHNRYLQNYHLINSPRLKTTISCVYRNVMPQVGDQLIVSGGLTYTDCGRIQSVALTYNRSGVILNITAEKYQFKTGKWNTIVGGAYIGGPPIP